MSLSLPMNRKQLILPILILFLTIPAFAQEQKPNFSGQDYINLAPEQKEEAIVSFIQTAKGKDITISKDPMFYYNKLDTFYKKHPDFLKEALFPVIKSLAMLENDWDEKGVDKDKVARDWLGEDLYDTNKVKKSLENETAE